VQNEGSISPEDLFAVLLPDAPLSDILNRITTMATRAVPGGAVAGLSLPSDGSAQTPIYTDQRARVVDQAQYDHGDGPCLRALRTGEVVAITDTSTDARWRWFGEIAIAQGIRSTISLPLDVAGNRDEVIGALNLYSETPERFDAEIVRALESFAQQAAILAANARAYWGAVELAEQLQRAMESRATIEQAKGILIARTGGTAEEAFALLVRASQRENRKLREIAAEVVERASSDSPASG